MKFLENLLPKPKNIKLGDVQKQVKKHLNKNKIEEYRKKFHELRGTNKTEAIHEVYFDKRDYKNKFNTLIRFLNSNNYDIKTKEIVLTIGEYTDEKRNLFEDSGFTNPFLTKNNAHLFQNNYVNWSVLPDMINFDIAQGLLFSDAATNDQEKALLYILKSIRKVKENSKISSIIIRLKSNFILNRNLSEEERLDAIKIYYNKMYKILNLINSEFDYKIPAYILITEIENIYGFSSFKNVIHPEEKNQILGISSQFGLDENYSDKYGTIIAEEFKQILKSFFSKKLLENNDEQEYKNLSLFINNFCQVIDKACYFTNLLFLNHSINSGFNLRGLFSCSHNQGDQNSLPLKIESYSHLVNKPAAPSADGEAKNNTETSSSANLNSDNKRVYFFRDLYNKKIFQDFYINLPSANLIKKNEFNTILSISILTMVTLISPVLFFNYHLQIKRSSSNIDYITNNISDIINNKEFEKINKINVNTSNINELIDIYNNIDLKNKNKLANILSPLSLFSNIDQKYIVFLQKMLITFEVQPLKKLAQQRLKDIVKIDVQANSQVSVEDAFQNLNDYVQNLSFIDNTIANFNSSTKEIKIDNINLIFEKLHNTELPDSFQKRNIIINNADVKYKFKKIDVSNSIYNIRYKFDFLFRKMISSIENEYIINDNSRKLISYIDHSKQNIINNDGYEYLQKIHEFLSNIIKKVDFYNSSSQILTASESEIKFEKLNSTLKNVSFLDQKYVQNIDSMVKEAVIKRNQNVLEYNSAILGSLFEKSEDKKILKLSKPFLLLNNQLTEYNKLDFTKPLKNDSLNKSISFLKNSFNWNTVDIDFLSKNIDLYYKYTTDKLNQFPDILKPFVNDTILIGLNKMLIKELNNNNIEEIKNKGFDPELETNTFIQRKDRIIKVIKFFNENDRFNISDELSKLTDDKVSDYFKFYRNKLKTNVHYEPIKGNFDWWDGILPPALEAYGVFENKDLVEYVNIQNQNLEKIVTENIRPLFQIISVSNTEYQKNKIPEYKFWKDLVTQVDNKDKNSTLRSLNTLIVSNFTTLNGDTCMAGIKRIKKDTLSRDYFTSKKNELLTLFSNRCKKIYQNNIAYEFNKIVNSFNLNLAGKFPFVDDYNFDRSDDADENVLKVFLKQFNSFINDGPTIKYILTSQSESWKRSLDFIRKMKNVSDFLSILTKSDQNQKNNSIDLFVDFTSLRSYELNSFGLLEKNMSISGKTISSLSLNKNISWNPGDEITMGFHWAKDYNQIPYLNENSGNDKYVNNVNEKLKTVSFTAKNKWALVYLIGKNAMSKTNYYYSPNLLFKIPIKSTSRLILEDIDPDKTIAKIIIKVNILNKANQAKLSVPVFPTQVSSIKN